MAVFKTENLTFYYPKSKSAALENVSIEISKGDAVLLTGESGSGKTTLLKLLKKELSPNGTLSGKITCNSSGIAYVGQNPDTSFVSETVRGELVFALENRAAKKNEISLRLGEIVSFFNIADILDSKLSELSGGERATVAIAAAMIDNADALLLDEPFACLDPKAVITVSSMLKRINEELGVTVLLSSHSTQEAVTFCSKMLVLSEGKCVCDMPLREAAFENTLLGFFPVCTRLFNERPLTVKEALPYADRLREKPLESQPTSSPAVEVKNITFSYSKKSPDILTRLSFTAYEGKINTVIGANGSGKTTLLKVIAGIKKAYSGKVKLSGKCAYMPQNVRCLFTKDTVGEEIFAETARQLGIESCLDQHPFDLSGGQAQKLAFGILLEQNADIFLLDEPSRAFDYKSKEILMQLLKELCSCGKTVIMVTHDIDFAGSISDYISFLGDGVIAAAGERRQVLSSLKFYTTQVRRITASTLTNAVSEEDLE